MGTLKAKKDDRTTYDVESLTFAAGGSGFPDTVDLQVSSDTPTDGSVTVHLATSDAADTLNRNDIVAGTGDTIEKTTWAFTSSGQTNLSGFTTPSEGTKDLWAVLTTVAGNDSAVGSDAATGLNFTRPTVSSAATNTAGDTVTLTMDKACFEPDGAVTPGDFTVSGVTGSPTVTGVVVSGTSITLTLSSTGMLSTDTVLANYTNTGNDIKSDKGNILANFSNQAVTNNVTGGGHSFTDSFVQAADSDITSDANWSYFIGHGSIGGTKDAVISNPNGQLEFTNTSAGSSQFVSIVYDGSSNLTANQKAEIDFVDGASSNRWCTLYFRAQDTDNYVIAGWSNSGSEWIAQERAGGSWGAATTVGSGTEAAPASGDTIIGEISGTTLTLKVDRSPGGSPTTILTHTISLTTGDVGVRTRMDNGETVVISEFRTSDL